MQIELYSKLQNPIEAIDKIGEFFAKSGMFGCERIEQGKVLAMVCLAEHKSPIEITRTYHIIGGKLSKRAMAAYAEFRKKGGKCRWIRTGDEAITKSENDRCAEAEFTWEDTKIIVSYAMAQAEKAQLTKADSGWIKRPGNMLRARVISNALGMIAPEIFAGAEDDESQPVPERSINLAAATATVDAAKPIEVQAEKIPADNGTGSTVIHYPTAPFEPVKKSEPPTIDMTPSLAVNAPSHTPTPEPATATRSPQETAASSTLLGQVEQIIGAAGDDAMAWFVREKWLQPGQSPLELPEARLKRIVTQKESFLRSIKGVANPKSA